MTANDGVCWVCASTSVIDDRVTSIGNAFDRGSAGLGDKYAHITYDRRTRKIPSEDTLF